MRRIGIIAGNRKFPLIFTSAAKKRGCFVVAVAIKKDTSSLISRLADKTYWLSLSEFGKLFEIFRKEGITEVVMAGQISPWRLFSREVSQSKDLKEILQGIQDKRADTIFAKISAKLEEAGLKLLDSTTFLQDYLPQKGTLTSNQPDEHTRDDISFGLSMAKAVAGLDIGQTVAVKSKAIVAVEAFEGTDNLIKRAGRVSGGGVTVVKVSKPNQDMRFDVPVIGLKTVKNLIKAKAKCLAIEAGKTLFIDREESLKLADKKGICIVAV